MLNNSADVAFLKYTIRHIGGTLPKYSLREANKEHNNVD